MHVGILVPRVVERLGRAEREREGVREGAAAHLGAAVMHQVDHPSPNPLQWGLVGNVEVWQERWKFGTKKWSNVELALGLGLVSVV